MTSFTKPPPKDTQPTQSALIRRTWNGRSSPIPKLPQAELIRKLEEEEIATLALHSKLKDVVNARMELEELKKKIQQMLSDVRDALLVIDGKGADLEHNREDSPTAATEDDNVNSSNSSHASSVSPNVVGGHNTINPTLSDEDRKKMEEEEKARKKAEERIQKERKKAEERQKKIREKEGSMLSQKQEDEKNEHADSSGGEIQIEVKSAFRKVEGITIDQLRQDAMKAQAEEAEKVDKEKSSDWSVKKFSKSILKKKDKKSAAADNLAMVMKMKAELIAQQKAATSSK